MSIYGIIVCDASPLITLAIGDQLDMLLRQSLPITVPDAVYREATNEAHADGVRIAKWIEANPERVRVAATEAGIEQDILLRAGRKARNFGETAAIEVTDNFLRSGTDEKAILLYEDPDVRKRAVDPRTEIVQMGAFLQALERSNFIQSADHVLDEAEAGGRDVSSQRKGPLNEPPPGLISQLREGRSSSFLDATPRTLSADGSSDPIASGRPRDMAGRSRSS